MSKTFKLKNFPESSQEALCHPFLYLTVLEYYQNVSMIFSKMLTNEYIFFVNEMTIIESLVLQLLLHHTTSIEKKYESWEKYNRIIQRFPLTYPNHLV